jgi:hypothetical protein
MSENVQQDRDDGVERQTIGVGVTAARELLEAARDLLALVDESGAVDGNSRPVARLRDAVALLEAAERRLQLHRDAEAWADGGDR